MKCLVNISVVMAMLALIFPSPLQGESPHWRGPEQNGLFTGGPSPEQLTESTLQWKAPLPGKGTSTPIIVEKTIYLTSPDKGQDAVLAFNQLGKELWRTLLGDEKAGKHRNGSGANASPATDGERLFVYFKSGHFAGLDLTGHVLWQQNLVEQYGPDTLYWDHGTSPVVTQTGVVMTRMHKGESWLASYDPKTGALQWKIPRNYTTPTEGDHGYTTPIVTTLNDKEVILIWGAQHLTAHDPSNGQVLWSCGDFNPRNVVYWPAVATPVLINDMVVVPFGRADKRQPRLHGIRLTGKGDVTASNRIWKIDDHSCFVPSPTTDGKNALVLSDRGALASIDPETGNKNWTLQLTEHRSSYYASPSVADGKLYAPREDGVVFVVDLENRSILSENDLGERVIGSPVALGHNVYIRGEKHLFNFTSKD